MAKSLHNMIRLGEWQVDEKRRALGVLLSQVAEMEAKQEALAAEMAAEQAFATSAPVEGGLVYGNYAAATLKQIDDLARAIHAVERDIDTAREELRLAYMDLKKYEILQRQRDEQEALELAKVEQAELDEIGLQRYRDRQDG